MPSNLPFAPNILSVAKFTTEEFARLLRIAPQSIRAGHCRNGHYLGLKPVKLSGRLLWDSAAVGQLLAGDTVVVSLSSVSCETQYQAGWYGGKTKNEEGRATQKDLQRNNLEQNRRRKFNTFKLPSPSDCQVAPDTSNSISAKTTGVDADAL